jgi:hypothetical protein
MDFSLRTFAARTKRMCGKGQADAEVAAVYDDAVINPPRPMKVSGPTCRSATSVNELNNMTSEQS